MMQTNKYVKKDDFPAVLKSQNMQKGAALIAMSLVFFLMGTLIIPRLEEMYADMNVQLSGLTQLVISYWWVLASAGALAGFSFITKEPDLLLLENLNNKYRDKNEEDMIDISQDLAEISSKNSLIVLLFLGGAVALLIIGIIQPIYSITASL